MSSWWQILDPLWLISTLGFVGVVSIIFAESGLFFGFFLPGDSLLFTAGFLASQNLLNLWGLLIFCSLAAILGDNFGYAFGRRVGPKIFYKEDSFFFRRSYIEKTRQFFARYGNKTIIFARFVPIVRTFAPILAGVGEMPYRQFLTYNIIGGTGWVFLLTLGGYFLGRLIPGVDQYLLPIVLLIILVSISPGLYHLYRSRQVNKITES